MHHRWMYAGMAGINLHKIQKNLQEIKSAVFAHSAGSVIKQLSIANKRIKQAKKIERNWGV